MKKNFLFLCSLLFSTLLHAQNVGIGNVSPLEKLEVTGNIRLSEGSDRTITLSNRTSNNPGNSLLISAGTAGSGSFAYGGGNLIIQAGNQYNATVNGLTGGNAIIRSGGNIINCFNCTNGGFISFETGTGNNQYTERVRIAENGNVGIGTISPTTARLVISGNSGEQGLDVSTTNQYANMRIIQNSNSSIDKDIYLGYKSGATSSLHLYSNDSATVTIANYRTGIGTETPVSVLDVRGATPVITVGTAANTGGAINFGTNQFGIERNYAAPLSNSNNLGIYTSSGGNLYLSAQGKGGGSFRINTFGYVGIGGTSDPQVPLHVFNAVGNGLGQFGYAYFTGDAISGPITGTRNNAPSISIKAEGRIAATEFAAYSDGRIKKVIGRTNNANDLAAVMKLQITDYRYIDIVENGNAISKKVIAQEVEKVYPNAVRKTKGFIPDIYSMSTIKSGKITVKNNLIAGDKVQLIFDDKREIAEVIEANAASFKVNLQREGKVFVYGKEIDDFRTVDYEALSTLNISATQELATQLIDVQKKIKQLEEKINLFVSPVTNIKK